MILHGARTELKLKLSGRPGSCPKSEDLSGYGEEIRFEPIQLDDPFWEGRQYWEWVQEKLHEERREVFLMGWNVGPEPVDEAARRKREGLCPTCGDSGEMVSMACVCRNGHGRIWG